MPDGQVVFEITGDNRKINDVLRDTTNDIEKESKKWDDAVEKSADNIEKSVEKMAKDVATEAKNSSDKIKDSFSKASKSVSEDMEKAADDSAANFTKAMARALDINRLKDWGLKAGKMLLDFGKDAVQAASDLEEVQNVVDVTFGEAGAAQIEKWAKAVGTQFGLTETQAKRFTSTLGAMMKSAGMSGPEIVSMSEDLAGLAADMASFYNLDFDTAFQKIRSGISGETEPLKQLGINMSVANLEAYALTQGITKAFDSMTQGEQTMLRYQYLMQATADAQGDFARTSDSYANAVRTLETNISNLKTNVGNVLIPIVSEVVGGINDMIEAMTQTKPTTVLDEFAAIDLKTEQKLGEIAATAEEARTLAGVLDDIAKKAGSLQEGVDADWRKLLTALEIGGGIDLSKAKNGVEGLAEALNGADPNTDRAQAWEQLLAALSADVEGLSKLTGTSAEETAAWLQQLAEGANALDPNSAEGWDKLFDQLRTGLTGGGLMESAVSELLAMGNGSEEARDKLRDLGYSTEDIDTMQKEWLETCKRLVSTIPGLSEVINAQTGEVEGGTEAIDEYVNAWIEGERKMALWSAHFAKGEALNQVRGQEYLAELDKITAEQRVKRNREMMDAILEKYGFGDEQPYEFTIPMAKARGISNEDFEAYNSLARERVELEADAAAAAANYERQVEDTAAAVQAYADEEAGLTERYGENTQAAAENAEAIEELTDAQKTAATEAVTATTKALEAVETYYSRVRQESEKSIQSVVKGFESIETPAEKARREMKDLTKQIDELNAAGKDSSGLTQTFRDAEASIPSIQNMTAALEDQLKYLNDYQNALDRARERGVSEDVLAYLADGSVESYDYLNALANDSGSIDELNKTYADVQAAQESLAQSLTDTRLAADTEFKGLVDAAQAAAEDLDQYGTAEASMANTVQGIADGIAEKIPDVQTQVDALNAVLANLGNVGGLVGGLFGGGFHLDGSHATGLDYVPFDNYLAQLHEGESILTAEEARVWRSFKNGGDAVRNTIDYSALHGAIWDGAPKMGGDVYLDGKTVGRVISDQQGNSLRALERSGWQR